LPQISPGSARYGELSVAIAQLEQRARALPSKP